MVFVVFLAPGVDDGLTALASSSVIGRLRKLPIRFVITGLKEEKYGMWANSGAQKTLACRWF